MIKMMLSFKEYMSSINRLVPLPTTPLNMTTQLDWLSFLASDIYVSIRGGLLLSTYLHFLYISKKLKVKVHGRRLQAMRLGRWVFPDYEGSCQIV